jgi:CrcB protein
VKRSDRRRGDGPAAPVERVAQATLRPRSELECERVIRLAHRRGIATATAYRGPEEGGPVFFVMIIDEPRNVEEFLPELHETVPEVPISVIREEVVHLSPPDFLRGGAYRPRLFRAQLSHMAWIFAGGTLGTGARILVESGARYLLSPAEGHKTQLLWCFSLGF